jgi:hypothetical protein
MTSTAILHQPLEFPAPLFHPVRHRAANLNRGNGGRSAGARTRIQRSAAKSIIPSIPMTPAIQATRTHDLQSDESHAQTPAMTAPLHLRQSHPLVSPSTTSLRVDDAQPQADHGCSPTLIHNEYHHTSRASRSPSATTEPVLVAEYEEWPFQSFLKRAKIGDDIMYNLEFKTSTYLGAL